MNSQVTGAFSTRVQSNAFVNILRVSRIEAVIVALDYVDVVGHLEELMNYAFLDFPYLRGDYVFVEYNRTKKLIKS